MIEFYNASKHPLRSRSEIVFRDIVVALLIIFFVVFFFIPIIIALVGSFYQWNPLRLQFNFLGLDNWKRAFQSKLLWQSMLNTVIFAAVAIAFRLIIGLALAQALFSKLIKHKTLYRVLYYMPTVTPMVAVAFVWKLVFNSRFGLLNNLLGTNINWLHDGRYALIAVLLLTIWKDFGFAFIIFLGSMYALPKDCYEAAEIDGAGAWRRFISITLPLLKPTVLLVAIMSLIGYFQTYLPVMVLTEGGPGTKTYLASYLIYQEAFVNYNFGYASTLSFVLFFIIAVLTGISFRVSGRENTL